MASLAPPNPTPRRGRLTLGRTAAPVAAALPLAAGLGYAVHHVGPLRGHAALSVAFGVALAVAAAVVPTVLALRRNTLPQVVVARPGDGSVRTARRGDERFTAALHREALEHGFFADLGPAFLRAYHRTFIDSPHAVGYLASVGDTPVGFLTGVLGPRAHARWVLSHRGVALATVGAASIALRPLVALRFLRTRMGRYVRGWRRHRAVAAPGPVAGVPAVLSHVAVLPGARGAGSGRELVDAFVHACRAAGADRVILLSLEGSAGAGAFYERLGWRRGSVTTTPDGVEMRQWELVLS